MCVNTQVGSWPPSLLSILPPLLLPPVSPLIACQHTACRWRSSVAGGDGGGGEGREGCGGGGGGWFGGIGVRGGSGRCLQSGAGGLVQ